MGECRRLVGTFEDRDTRPGCGAGLYASGWWPAATEDEMHFSYVTRRGVHHELWFESGDTLRQKLPLLYQYQMRGVSVWRLGFEDPAFWDLIVPRR